MDASRTVLETAKDPKEVLQGLEYDDFMLEGLMAQEVGDAIFPGKAFLGLRFH